ncbi:MAG: putative glycoside hydrolase [Gemmatimonadota bacterium]|nr:putative glycoside hydrolase [Gemmatimonadota bacterium]
MTRTARRLDEGLKYKRHARRGRLIDRPRIVICHLVAISSLLTSCRDEPDASLQDATTSVSETPVTTQPAQIRLESTSPSPGASNGSGERRAIETGFYPNLNTVEESTTDDAETTPKIPAREITLAWLADNSILETFPATTARTGQGAPVARLVLPKERLSFTKPSKVRGLYMNAWAAGSSRRSQALIDLAKRTEINSLVIDVKDASGYVSYPTHVLTAREVGADQEIRIRDLVDLVERLHHANIYPIARIVVVKDPLFIRGRPEVAVQDTAGGVWVDGKGLIWANLHNRTVWEYHVELAKEVAAAGFPEIQWDYVRFPDAPREDLGRAVFPGAEGRTRRDAVEAFLEYARGELAESGVGMTVDVFGATTSATNDIGIGQYWERFISTVDVALPMVYPSHYWAGSFAIQDPNSHPYEIVYAALQSGLERSQTIEEAGTIRPWLQDFTLGPPVYGAPEVRAQIQATYDAGIDEWLLWNPSSRYTEGALVPFGGYPEGMEPIIRAGGRIGPVSERYLAMEAEALERTRAEELAKAEATQVQTESGVLDSTSIRTPPDTVGIQR